MGMTTSGAARERLPQARHGSREARLDRTWRAVQRLRHLGLAHVEEVAVGEHSAVVRAQLFECEQQCGALLVGDDALLRRTSTGDDWLVRRVARVHRRPVAGLPTESCGLR